MGGEDYIVPTFERINAIWPNARLNASEQSKVSVWREALGDLPREAIREGYRALSRCDDRAPPSPGRYRRMCWDSYSTAQERKRLRQASLQKSQAEEGITPRSPEGEAWAAAQAAFARRICGEFAHLVPVFQTDFDAEYVAVSIPLPTTSVLEDHQAAFARLKQLFELEWSKQQ